MNPVYSVIMVTYYHENYIRRALESVLSQTVVDSIEIIIGDDGSKDNTIFILKEYEKKYSFIHVYAHENWGLSKNLYSLLKKAKGKYIAILEGDDYWIDNRKIEKQVFLLDNNNCIATCCNCIKKDNDDNNLGLWNYWKNSKLLSKHEVLNYQTHICHPSGLFMKNIFMNSADKYCVIEQASRMGGNHTGMINLLSSIGGLYYDKNPMFVWRVVKSSSAMNYSSQKVDNFMDFYEAMHKYEAYDRAFDYNYERHILQQYIACKKAIKKEIISNIGYKRFLLGYINCFIYKIWAKLFWKE